MASRNIYFENGGSWEFPRCWFFIFEFLNFFWGGRKEEVADFYFYVYFYILEGGRKKGVWFVRYASPSPFLLSRFLKVD